MLSKAAAVLICLSLAGCSVVFVKVKGRTLAELRAFLGMFTGEDSTVAEKRLAVAFLEYLSGTATDDEMTAVLAEYCAEEVTS